MKETYTLLLNSQNTANRFGSNIRNYQYYVNWSSFLPKPENINQKYLVKFSMFGLAQASFAECYSINIDFGGSNMYDNSNSKTSFLGVTYPYYSGTFAYLKSRLNDNPAVTIEYPNNSLITVNIVNINTGSGVTLNVHYMLTLEFTPI
jgi:hypothetical protein